MNCRRLQDKIFEYVDGSLSPRAQAAAKRHLEECDACRQKVNELQRTGQSLSIHFRQATESLTLSPKVTRRIMAAVEEESTSPAAIHFFARFWQPLAWLGTGVALLLLSVFLVTGFPNGLRVRHRGTAESFRGDSGAAISIRIAYCEPTYTFRSDGNSVIDSLICQPRIVEESLLLSRSQIHHQQERKSPL
jgi:anti-sigma factor RsiW